MDLKVGDYVYAVYEDHDWEKKRTRLRVQQSKVTKIGKCIWLENHTPLAFHCLTRFEQSAFGTQFATTPDGAVAIWRKKTEAALVDVESRMKEIQKKLETTEYTVEEGDELCNFLRLSKKEK